MTLVQILYLFVGARFALPFSVAGIHCCFSGTKDVFQERSLDSEERPGELAGFACFVFVINRADTTTLQKENGTVELLMYQRRPKPTSN